MMARRLRKVMYAEWRSAGAVQQQLAAAKQALQELKAQQRALRQQQAAQQGRAEGEEESESEEEDLMGDSEDEDEDVEGTGGDEAGVNYWDDDDGDWEFGEEVEVGCRVGAKAGVEVRGEEEVETEEAQAAEAITAEAITAEAKVVVVEGLRQQCMELQHQNKQYRRETMRLRKMRIGKRASNRTSNAPSNEGGTGEGGTGEGAPGSGSFEYLRKEVALRKQQLARLENVGNGESSNGHGDPSEQGRVSAGSAGLLQAFLENTEVLKGLSVWLREGASGGERCSDEGHGEGCGEWIARDRELLQLQEIHRSLFTLKEGSGGGVLAGGSVEVLLQILQKHEAVLYRHKRRLAELHHSREQREEERERSRVEQKGQQHAQTHAQGQMKGTKGGGSASSGLQGSIAGGGYHGQQVLSNKNAHEQQDKKSNEQQDEKSNEQPAPVSHSSSSYSLSQSLSPSRLPSHWQCSQQVLTKVVVEVLSANGLQNLNYFSKQVCAVIVLPFVAVYSGVCAASYSFLRWCVCCLL
jgi:hypothetical protein